MLSSILCVLILRGARDQAPNTMDMDTQPQGQQAAVPVFQPQVDFIYRHTRAPVKLPTRVVM